MRIINGKYKNHVICTPSLKVSRKLNLRPTKSKVRVAVFNILNSILDFKGVSALDLYCGVGAFGIEAISMGAEHATFVDINEYNIKQIRRNVERINITESIDYVCIDACNLKSISRCYDLIYVDPPYKGDYVERSVKEIIKYGLLSTNGLIILEISSKRDLKPLDGLDIFDKRIYGQTKILFCKLTKECKSR